MSLRNLPKSLIDSVQSVLTSSSVQKSQIYSQVCAEGLKHFGVTSLKDLTEAELKAFHAWTQIRLAEAGCHCNVDEDDMPGDAPYHKGGNENADKKTELDEGDAAQAAVSAELKKLGKTLGELSPEEKKELFNKVDAHVDAKNEDSDRDVYESVSLEADEIATNGAVGVTDADEQLPVHADVLKDSTPVEGKTEYRLFVQFNTNTLPVIVPPVTLPGAPTIDALRDIVEGLPFFCDVCERALSAAADLPHESPKYNGETVSESYVPTQYDKKIMAAIKQTTKAQKVKVLDYTTSGIHIREYSAVLEKTNSEDVLYFGCMEAPSRKSPGKMTWTIRYELNDENADPNVGGKVKMLVGEPFPAGVELKSLSSLKSVLAKLPIN
jgi:hypothetical protein